MQAYQTLGCQMTSIGDGFYNSSMNSSPGSSPTAGNTGSLYSADNASLGEFIVAFVLHLFYKPIVGANNVNQQFCW